MTRPEVTMGENAELHASATVRRHDDAGPIERIRTARGVDTIEGELGAHKEHEKRDGGVQGTLAERNLAIGSLHLGEHREEGAHKVKEAELRRHDVRPK